MYAQSLSLRSEELDADTVYSFVPNIGDSDPSSRCTYWITNGAYVDLNHSFKKQVLRTQLCVHHDEIVIVIWVIWSKCASKRTKMRVMENPGTVTCRVRVISFFSLYAYECQYFTYPCQETFVLKCCLLYRLLHIFTHTTGYF